MTTHNVEGIAFFARVHSADQFGKYSVSLVVDADTSTALQALGLKPARHNGDKDFAPKRMEGHETKDVFVLSRPEKITFKDKETGMTMERILPKPAVADAEGNAITDLIGNGSTVRVYLTVRDTVHAITKKPMKKANLEGVQVLKLVKVESSNSNPNDLQMITNSGKTVTVTREVPKDTGKDDGQGDLFTEI